VKHDRLRARLRARLHGLGAALLVAGLTLLFFWKLVFTNLILVGVDSFLYFYPYKTYVAQALSEGRFPLWNPHLFMGAPLLANMQTAILYPLHWPALWLSAPKQVAASIVLHVMLAGWGTLAFARHSLKLSWLGALTAAVIFALGGFVGAQTEHVNQLNVIAWLPWTFLLLDVAVESRRRVIPTLGLGLMIGLMLLAGHAQATYICLVGLGLYALAGGETNTKYQIANQQISKSASQRVNESASEQVSKSASQQGSKSANHGSRITDHGSRVTDHTWLATARAYLVSRLPYLGVLAAAVGIGVLLAAVQLLPTLELSRLSVRSGGLSYREVISFSLRPWRLHFTLLPPYGVDLSQVFGEAFSEYVAYVGVIGLGLAVVGLLRGWRRQTGTRFFALLTAVGLFLGLGGFNPFYFLYYKIIPGFDLFRAPARWMLLYAFGVAMLAGIGMGQISKIKFQKSNGKSAGQPVSKSRITDHGSRSTTPKSQTSTLVSLLLFVLLCVELFVASRGLRYNQPTAPEAFSFLRPSIAHLKTDPDLFRFLSLSGIVYDPGDLAEITTIFADQLPEKAIYDYVVAAKEKEVLFYNLPLLYGLNSVDGYDGGLLPLRDFVTMERLFLDEEQLSVDGRLRENLRDVPPSRLLSLLGVKYVITDKVFDVWIEGLFYDLQFSARLSPGDVPSVSTSDLPDFPTTALGVISHLEGGQALPDGTPVARVTVAEKGGWSETYEMLAGRDTSEGRYRDGVAHGLAPVGHTWRDDPSGQDYVTQIPLDGPRRLATVTVEGVAPAGDFVLRGLSLVDTRTTTTRQVNLSTDGNYRLVHSGDVKIYQNLDVLPRAFVVHQAEVVADDEEAIARLRDPAFAAAQRVLLAGGEPLAGAGTAEAEIVSYTPEEIFVKATTDAPGYLLLTDTFYPGWQATVDGQPAEIQRADLMFRAVRLEPGTHQVVYRYQPASVRWGTWISALALVLWLGFLVWALRPRRVVG
jgi:hypothetical protein